ncbi:MAG: protein-export chaperone SecB [Ruminiclostridium sp.]|nr:protein-export chaperone SecB [Ruminiclostridium sp.]
MVYLSLKQQVFKEILLSVDVKEDATLELESTFSFNVSYNEDNSLCIAKLRQEVRSNSASQLFNIVVEGIGHFVCEGINTDEDKKQAHVNAYALLFPYVQSKIADLSRDAGAQAVMIDMAKMRIEDVKIGK